jgi:dTDP-glucose pyrophosphorylase
MKSIDRAVILAAGRGTRMGNITDEMPKPMLPIAGKPMLEHILERLTKAGVQRFLIVVGYHREIIRTHFADSAFDIEFQVQEPVNGTGAAALLSREFAGEQPFLLTFGDILCSPGQYTRAIEILGTDPDTQAVLAVKAVDDPWQGAAVYEENGRILKIIEKPPMGTSRTSWNSAGFYCFRIALFGYLERLKPSIRHEYELTSAIDAMLADGLRLKISPVEGEWRDVGRPEDLAAVNENARFFREPSARE